MPLTEVKNITQFLLVPSLWGCCYGQPPAVNHIVVVKMPPGQTTKFYDDVIRIRGEFNVGKPSRMVIWSASTCSLRKKSTRDERGTPTVYKPCTETARISLKPLGRPDPPLHTHAKLDRLGIWLSAACAVHCMVMPIVMISFPYCCRGGTGVE